MATQNDTGQKSFPVGAAIGAHLRVKISSGVLAVGAITDTTDIGVTRNATFAAGEVVEVDLFTKPGTIKCTAAAAITAGALVYTAASGKVSVSASTARIRGIAMEAATADGDVIEVMPLVGETVVV